MREVDFDKSFLLKTFVWSLLIILGVCVVVVAVHSLSEKEETKPVPRVANVETTPLRGEFKPLRLRRTGFVYQCNECHKAFQTDPKRKRLIAEHEEIELKHGRNDYCLNCHHKTNRNVYTDHDGSEIPSEKPAQLCAKCHGPIYQDWQAGAHGKLSGNWNPQNENARKWLCIECHDPHEPQIPKFEPMPGPDFEYVHAEGVYE